jgi:hypothetical protein
VSLPTDPPPPPTHTHTHTPSRHLRLKFATLCRCIVAAGIVPLLLQPAAWAVRGSWESRNAGVFIALYTIEAPIFIAVCLLTMMYSYGAGAALASSRALMIELEKQAARLQGLLEAAMPPVIARALLDDIPAASLMRRYVSWLFLIQIMCIDSISITSIRVQL